jgi:Ca-activated chloride channel family protein
MPLALRTLVNATLLALALAAPAAAQVTSGPTVLIVLDGSNSMNGRIGADPTPKHVLVREAMRRTLPKLAPSTRIGLVTFGHRRGADCTDVELVMPPAPVNAQGTADILASLPPRGYSPVMPALREAAKAAAGAPEPASIVLILDDLASCKEDPCAAAAEIAAANPKLAIHVVGLALKPEEAQQLACVPARTGGRLYTAADAAAVAAAIDAVLVFAGADRRPAPARKAPPPVAKAPSGVDTAQPSAPGLSLSASLTEQGAPLGRPLSWRVARDSATAETVAELQAPALDIDLPPGRYTVEVQLGLARAVRQLEVTAKGRTRTSISLEAASLALTAALQKGARPSPEAVFTVAPVGSTGQALLSPLWVGQAGGGELVLPAGPYRIVAEEGLARAERRVTIRPGESAGLEVPLGASRLEVDAGPPRTQQGRDQVLFLVQEDDPDSPDGRREVARSAAPHARFTLPPGTYHITARRGMAEAKERVVLRHGEEVKRTLTIGVARVQLATKLAGATASTSEQVSYRLTRLDGGTREVLRTSVPEPILELTPGQYRIESRIGTQNAVAVRDVELKSGTEQRIVLEQPAGFVRLRLGEAGGAPVTADVFWRISDAAGRLVWRTGQFEPQLVLAAGRYVVRAELRDRVVEQRFEVRAGETRRIDVAGG